MLMLVSGLLLLCGEQEGDPNSAGSCEPHDVNSGSSDGGGGGGGGGESFEDRLNEIVDNVIHSKMVEDLKVRGSEVMEDLKIRGSEVMEDLKVRGSEVMEDLKVRGSEVMEDLKVRGSEVMEELKNLPSEIGETLLLQVQRRSLVVGGVMVAVFAALLLLGCLWIHWCHTEHGEYRYVPISQLEEFLRYQTPPPASSSPTGPPSGSRPPRQKRSKKSSSENHKERVSSSPEGSQLTHRRTDHEHIANGGR